jgi:hypothetical protein
MLIFNYCTGIQIPFNDKCLLIKESPEIFNMSGIEGLFFLKTEYEHQNLEIAFTFCFNSFADRLGREDQAFNKGSTET